ncbi:type VI secretion system tip protein VgrG, partial [Pseudomonas syringae pv. actinidiae]|nr:type VI secretion system tip protein VgrG [Pseudomonas syringae pv. actinidiae]
QEQIYVHAQRNWDQNIKHDQKIRIGHERHDRVEANSYSEFKAQEHRLVDGDRLTETKADDHLTVGGTRHLKLGNALLAEAGQEIHLKSANKIVLEAGMELTLKVAGSFIKIDASGVTVGGPATQLNSGGSPGSGSGAKPLIPGPTLRADMTKPGEVLAYAQRRAMKRTARCEVCEQQVAERRPRNG